METMPRNPFTYPSVFKEMARIAKEGKFLDTNKLVGPNEKILGQMTKMEAALLTIINRLKREHEGKFVRFIQMKAHGILSEGEECTGQMDLAINEIRTVLLTGTLTQLVKDRIGWNVTANGIDFRQGFQIVTSEDNSEQQLVVKLRLGTRS